MAPSDGPMAPSDGPAPPCIRALTKLQRHAICVRCDDGVITIELANKAVSVLKPT